MWRALLNAGTSGEWVAGWSSSAWAAQSRGLSDLRGCCGAGERVGSVVGPVSRDERAVPEGCAAGYEAGGSFRERCTPSAGGGSGGEAGVGGAVRVWAVGGGESVCQPVWAHRDGLSRGGDPLPKNKPVIACLRVSAC